MKCGFLSLDQVQGLSAQKMSEREYQGVQLGISRLIMMENAGNAIARLIADRYDSYTSVLLIAGTGNNGGDVFVAARHLAYWKNFRITVALIGIEAAIRMEEAQTNWKILKNIERIKRIEINSTEAVTILEKVLQESQVIVTGIFGTGFRGKPRVLQESVINMVNTAKGMKISVDIPSGMEADTGDYETAVQSDFTIAMDSPKIGLQAKNAGKVEGKVLVANIGVPF